MHFEAGVYLYVFLASFSEAVVLLVVTALVSAVYLMFFDEARRIG